jgi:nucleoside-diphosphate-sugar epimerase
MNILLIGGGGYLGIPLSKELTKKGHNVVVFDKFKYNTQDLIAVSYTHLRAHET